MVLGVFLMLSGCDCDETPISRQCTSHADCDANQHCEDGLCREGKPVCVKGGIEEGCDRCLEHSDCPDGSRCSRSGLCVPPQCDADSDCTNLCAEQGSALEVCQTDPDSGWRQCVDFVCETDAQCQDAFVEVPEGLSAACVARGCRCRNPCGGSCTGSTVCCGADGDERYGQCIEDPGPCGELQCGLGYEAVLDEEGAWSMARCRREGDACRCEELPALDPGLIGIQSDLAMQGEQAAVVAYNSTYGDLLVGVGDQDGLTWQGVDGIPLATPENVTGAPSGPRFGVSEKGADLGRFPGIAVAGNGTVHVVYQNVDERSIVYARSVCAGGCNEGEVCTDIGRCIRPTEDCDTGCLPGFACIQGNCAEDARPNKFRVFELDGRGEAGYHNALVLDRNGIPHVLSAVHRFDHQGVPSAEWRRYSGRNDVPNGPEDFSFVDGSLAVDARLVRSLAQWPCEGGCVEGQVCVGLDNRCVTPTEDCEPGCGDGEICLMAQCVAENPVLPRGGEVVINAYNQLIRSNSGVVLGAWYDTVRDQPVLMEADGVIVDVQTRGGAFLSLRAGDGPQRHLAFTRNEQVVYVRAHADGTVEMEQVVDDGGRTFDDRSELHVLADTALDLAPDGTLTLYWQDATDHTLRYATKGPDDEAFGSAQVLAGQGEQYAGSYGFSNRTARNNRGAWLSSFRFHLHPDEPASGVVLFAR